MPCSQQQKQSLILMQILIFSSRQLKPGYSLSPHCMCVAEEHSLWDYLKMEAFGWCRHWLVKQKQKQKKNRRKHCMVKIPKHWFEHIMHSRMSICDGSMHEIHSWQYIVFLPSQTCTFETKKIIEFVLKLVLQCTRLPISQEYYSS